MQVPNLFDQGEALAIGEAVRTRAKAAHMDGSRADLFAFFVQEVRRGGVGLCSKAGATVPGGLRAGRLLH